MIGWYLTRVNIWIPGDSTVDGVMTSGAAGTSNDSSVAVSDYIGCESDGMSGSSISTTCGDSCHFFSTPEGSKFPSIFSYGIPASSSSDSSPTPGIYTSPMIRPCMSVEVNFLGWIPPNVLTRAITVSGMKIRSQLRPTIFFAVLGTLPCICLVYSCWDQGKYLYCLLEIDCYVSFTPCAPGSTVLTEDVGAFYSI